MSITQRIHDLIAESHATGYASELPDSVSRLFHELAGEVEKLKAGGGGAPLAAIEQLRAGLEHDLGDKLGEVFKAFAGKQVAAIAELRAELAPLMALLHPQNANPQPAAAAPAAPAPDAAPAQPAG